jgi:DNA-binding LytR/AlgR family response regulator
MKILIIEKESLIQKAMGKELKTLGYEVTASVENHNEVFEVIQKDIPDILLLDIKKENTNSFFNKIETVKQLSIEYDLPVILLGENDQLDDITSINDLSNFSYLHKPFTVIDLDILIKFSFKNFVVNEKLKLRPYTDRFLIRDNCELVCLHVSNILWIKSRRGIIQLQLSNGKSHTLTMTLSNFIRQFQHPELLRIHSSHIINLRYMEKIIGNTAYLNGESFKIGEVHSKTLKALFTTIKT